jgi:hypothetical protein
MTPAGGTDLTGRDRRLREGSDTHGIRPGLGDAAGRGLFRILDIYLIKRIRQRRRERQ